MLATLKICSNKCLQNKIYLCVVLKIICHTFKVLPTCLSDSITYTDQFLKKKIGKFFVISKIELLKI